MDPSTSLPKKSSVYPISLLHQANLSPEPILAGPPSMVLMPHRTFGLKFRHSIPKLTGQPVAGLEKPSYQFFLLSEYLVNGLREYSSSLAYHKYYKYHSHYHLPGNFVTADFTATGRTRGRFSCPLGFWDSWMQEIPASGFRCYLPDLQISPSPRIQATEAALSP